jgi:hypothetical protein
MLLRIMAVAVGCVVAIAAAGVILSLAIWLGMLAGSGFRDINFGLIRYIMLFAVPLTATLSLVPTLVLVLYGEWAAKHHLPYYVAGGALCGIVSLILHVGLSMWRGSSAGRLIELTSLDAVLKLAAVIMMVAVTGALAGVIYWALAGRRAGATS